MIVRCFLVLFTMLLFLGCHTDNAKFSKASVNDSIEKYIKLGRNDTLSVTQQEQYSQKAFSMIDLDRNDTVVRYYLCETALNFSGLKKGDKYLNISKIHLQTSLKAKDTLNLARYYRYRAGYFRWNNRNDSAFFYYNMAQKLYKKTDTSQLVAVYYYKGLTQFYMDDYSGAELSVKHALMIDRQKNIELSYRILNTLGNISHNLNQYHKAIKIHKQALKFALNHNLVCIPDNFYCKDAGYNNIGNSYKELKDYKKALYYFNLGLKQEKVQERDPGTYACLLNNIGYCKQVLKDKDLDENIFLTAAKIFDSLNIKNECSISNVYLSDYYLQKKDTQKAISYSEKAMKLAKTSKGPYYYLIALSQAGKVNKRLASKYILDYHRINDSLQFEQRKARSQFYRIQLETDEIAKEKDQVVRQKWMVSLAISGLLIIVILLFIVYWQRVKHKQLILHQKQQKTKRQLYQLQLNQQSGIEEARQKEKNRIATELHDGIMNKLVSTRMNLFVLSKKRDPETIAQCLGYIEDMRRIENDIRNLSHDLNQDI